MKSKTLLITACTLLFSFGAQAQYVDVTSQYIPNAGFEECEALPVVVYHDNQKDIDINKTEVWSNWNIAKGTDYESTGWKLVEQMKNANGGVVVYGINIQSGQYASAGEPGPSQGITGTKGLCFSGAAGLVYQQVNEITLPAGTYRLTTNLYARNGQTTNPGPTQQVNNIKTGFMPTGGTEDDLIPAKRNSKQFASNAWDTEVLDIELTQPTTGRFQISYGSSYFVIVDDVKLEYLGGVVTTSLQQVVDKAQTLNGLLEDETLAAAIGVAQDFIANPTSQDDVATQVETLYTAMSTALANTSRTPIDITSAYVENPSFETGSITPWTWGTKSGSVCEPTNEKSFPYIDGNNIVEFTTNGSNAVSQTIGHLPAGYYAIDARLNQKATLILGTNKTVCQGGTDYLFLNVHPSVLNFAGGDLTIGIEGSATYRCDQFRLFYGKDEESLLTTLLQTVKANATTILGKTDFVNVTGEERTDLQAALEGTDMDAINAAANAFVSSKDAYDDWVKAKAAALAYTTDNYPYAKAETLQTIELLLATEVTSRSIALENTTALTTACKNVYWDNAYCEGVSKEDYTEKIVAANVSSKTLNAAWTVNNVAALQVSSYKARPTREGGSDRYVYGTPDSYNTGSSSMQQTINGMPAGNYVLSVSMMAAKDLPVDVRVNSKKIKTFTGTGHNASSGWSEVVANFQQDAEGSIVIRIDEAASATTKMWYADNFRLYRLNEDTGISSIVHEDAAKSYYNLNGQRIAQPGKGLYIVKGRKVIVK